MQTSDPLGEVRLESQRRGEVAHLARTREVRPVVKCLEGSRQEGFAYGEVGDSFGRLDRRECDEERREGGGGGRTASREKVNTYVGGSEEL